MSLGERYSLCSERTVNVSELCIFLCAITATPIMCGGDVCDGTTTDDDDNPQDQCCQHIVFVGGCCSQQQNDNLLLMYVRIYSAASRLLVWK